MEQNPYQISMKRKISMKKYLTAFFALFSLSAGFTVSADELVILHTNDTHSQIDPADNGRGGVVRRKVLIDSVRAAQPNVLLVDAGDAVQGTLFFNLFKGEVEHKAMDLLGYDYAVVGNHDFDNAAEGLAANLEVDRNIKWLTTNYDLDGSLLEGKFRPYDILEFSGKRIGLIALNLIPKGMISEGNYDGVRYIDAVKAANSTAWHLKHNEKVDYVVAITHLGTESGHGRPSDVSVANASEDIDLIIGGHSHTRLPHGRRVANQNGDSVLITQAGSRGYDVGLIRIDLDSLTARASLIPVDSRLDKTPADTALVNMIAPYRHKIDSIMGIRVANARVELDKQRLLNLFADLVLRRGMELAPGVELSIINKGGIRRTLPKGELTVGHIMTALPFNNKVTVIDISGRDLFLALETMAGRGGDGIGGAIKVETDDSGEHIAAVTVGGIPLDPKRTYRVATIDYLANGGDYMESMINAEQVAVSPDVLYSDVIRLLRKMHGRINPSPQARM